MGVHRRGPTQASDPPGIERFMSAIARVESGGNHRALNKTSGASAATRSCPTTGGLGARYLGNANAKPTLANQERWRGPR
jgi:hypothetical protein